MADKLLCHFTRRRSRNRPRRFTSILLLEAARAYAHAHSYVVVAHALSYRRDGVIFIGSDRDGRSYAISVTDERTVVVVGFRAVRWLQWLNFFFAD